MLRLYCRRHAQYRSQCPPGPPAKDSDVITRPPEQPKVNAMKEQRNENSDWGNWKAGFWGVNSSSHVAFHCCFALRIPTGAKGKGR